ncbi:MAG TPA: hypothetical protein VMF12_19235 [Xanthobacteraceae bacterium]|nr:hypothetical protein [Xanthobacteraceae bacterium]
MRCMFVNGARLKAPASCAHCGNQIGTSYVREIATRIVFCDFRCYSAAVEMSLRMLGYRTPTPSARTRRS